VQNEDYVRTARAKGLHPLVVDSRHVMRNALLPVSTIIGLQTGLLLSGAVLTETIFAWPGIGSLLVQSVYARDYPVVQAAVFVTALFVAVSNLATDLVYVYLDPRIVYR
jgi:peptide/nickel transport system permease protein